MLINGQQYFGPQDAASLASITSMLALGERQFKICPEQVINPNKVYLATLHTSEGDIVIELLADKAPTTVNSFVFLAKNGWFDNITFHRVIPGFVAQSGDPSGSGMGNPGYYINNEIDPTLKYDSEGMVGMANSGPDTNGSQFFITLGPAPHLNGSYTIFGRVIEGMDVAKSLTERDPQPGQTLPPGDRLLSVTIEEK
jgi:cyclophilin family peptidyl-prolyl cis-trans isomerase